MSDIKIECPHCSQHLDVPELMLGTIAECPRCRGSFQLPHPVAKCVQVEHPIQRAASDKISSTQQCPFCGETILKIAVKCKHCGSFLGQKAASASRTNGEESSILPVFSKPAGPIGGMGWALLLTPFISALIFQFLLHGAIKGDTDDFSPFFVVGFIPVLLTTILITIEAVKVGAGGTNDLNPKGTRREGPVLWFITGLLFCIVVYPWWMKRRAEYGFRNLRVFSILSMIAWFVVTPLLASIFFPVGD